MGTVHDVKSEAKDVASEMRLLRALDWNLHAMSQPMTVLLCSLECGRTENDVAEIRQIMHGALETCDKLRETVNAMQHLVKQAIEEGIE